MGAADLILRCAIGVALLSSIVTGWLERRAWAVERQRFVTLLLTRNPEDAAALTRAIAAERLITRAPRKRRDPEREADPDSRYPIGLSGSVG